MKKLQRLFGKVFTRMRPNQEPLLNYSESSLKRVYWLSDELKNDPKQIELTRALTLNIQRPQMGLKGKYGLFASPEWWNNINQRKMPLKFISGIVVTAYEAGQDQTGENNTVELKVADGSVVAVGIYANKKADIPLFKPGAIVEIVYALDELKKQPAPDGGVAHSKVALEMAVSCTVASTA